MTRTYILDSTTAVSCHKTYPYAFAQGTKCCQTNKDNNGRPLTIKSNSCAFDAYRNCPGSKCKDFKGLKNITLLQNILMDNTL